MDHYIKACEMVEIDQKDNKNDSMESKGLLEDKSKNKEYWKHSIDTIWKNVSTEVHITQSPIKRRHSEGYLRLKKKIHHTKLKNVVDGYFKISRITNQLEN